MDENRMNNTEKGEAKFDPYTGKPIEKNVSAEEKHEKREENPKGVSIPKEDNGETAFFDPVTQMDSARFIGREVPSEEGNLYNDDYDENYEEDYDDEDDYYDKKRSKKSNNSTIVLIITAIIVLIVFISVMIWAMTSLDKKDTEEKEDEISVVEDDTENEPEKIENEPEEDKKDEGKNVLYYISFMPESVIETDDGYSVLVYLYNDSMKKVGNEKIYLDETTSIKEDGEGLSIESFIYVIENLEDESTIFKGKINDKTNVLKSVTYKSEILESVEEEPEEIEDETVKDENTETENETEEVTEEPEEDPEEKPEEKPVEDEKESGKTEEESVEEEGSSDVKGITVE